MINSVIAGLFLLHLELSYLLLMRQPLLFSIHIKQNALAPGRTDLPEGGRFPALPR